VLIVTEDEEVRRLIRSAVAEVGLRVLDAPDARQALRRAAEARVDVVATDFDGTAAPDLIGQLRIINPEVKVLRLVDDRAPRRVADLHVHKPFYLGEISEAVVDLLFGRCRCPSCLRLRTDPARAR